MIKPQLVFYIRMLSYRLRSFVVSFILQSSSYRPYEAPAHTVRFVSFSTCYPDTSQDALTLKLSPSLVKTGFTSSENT